ncbi:DNA oxidative demethylase ALKBH2 [Pseudocercospora fuligena]|uniref:DNA oxidative demethylase ALKBH2 n=1 Tax=Pseudocercospora fuligena TaxID=685502 RepID=A0A8H6RVS4_9PEZI|nr:DNA oxidative demethylase ALKBH2 [Pseudocercospora fuligena]
MSKRPRTLENFFSPPPVKRAKAESREKSGDREIAGEGQHDQTPREYSEHPTYPFPVPKLPASLRDALNFAPAEEGRLINDQPDLDLVYYQPYIPKEVQRDLFQFLRDELFFYRVKYTIKRGPIDTQINTPRYTTVFGIDETARFDQNGVPVDALTSKVLPKTTYKCRPRPIPECLDALRQLTENATGCKFNFSLVNYYASGDDSISYHSDDERFLGIDPAIASFSLGAKRDFLLKHKPTSAKDDSESKPMKLPLASGDMILMRGRTQSNWLHSIPKRKSGDADRGRINITFRRAMVKGGTENYYRYNVGDGGAYKWDSVNREMSAWKPS